MTTPKKTKDTLEEVDDFLAEAILIPIKGKKYRVDAIGIKTGLKLQAHFNQAQTQFNKGVPEHDIELDTGAEDEDTYFRSILGNTYDELLEDDVSGAALQHIIAIVFAWTFSGFDAAKEYYDAGGKAPAANRAARRTGTQTRKAAANTTKPRASATTTKSKSRASTGKKS